ncbi:MAG: LytTR family DNA-binding domain-containing protein [Saprospiraceae bacterium]|jgi:DNA-binding LytR/AlgR family response regulator|nr:response regulator transcription factor [Saprospiraceae bacterium]
MGLRCLVIDDDPLIGDLIKHFCSKTDLVSFCIQAENATDGLKLLAAGGLDLIFLDYNLPDMKGQEFLELMQAELPVIMVTSESEFAAKSYEYKQVLDFLVKPLSFDRFMKALGRMDSQSHDAPKTHSKDKTIFVKDGLKLVRINFDEVLYIKSEGNYANFIQEQSQTMNLISMKELEEKLPAEFVRVHRSFIVNIKKIQIILQDDLVIKDKHIPIGEKYKADLLNRIQEL